MAKAQKPKSPHIVILIPRARNIQNKTPVLIGTMEFPIRRSDLITYRTNVLLKAETDARINKLVTKISDGVFQTVKSTTDRKYVYNATHDLVFARAQYTLRDPPPDQQIVINKVLESLKQMFPDSAIILDPLLKTITVEWSQMGPGDWKG